MFCVVLCLCGCNSFTSKNNITSLLSAPKLNENESNIVAAIEGYLGEDINLRYSKNQGYSAPVQLMDVDADGNYEAVVFYYAPNKGANIRFALLSYVDDRWNIVDDKEGLGTEVFYFDTITLPEVSGKQIMVGYQSVNIDENFFVTYFTDAEKDLPDYVERCQNIVTGDITGNGYNDVVLTKVASGKYVYISVLSFTDELSFKNICNKTLKYPNIEIAQLVVNKLTDGRTAVFADYTDKHNRMYTEIYSFENGRMISCIEDGIVVKNWEHEPVIVSRDIDADGYLETATVMQPQHPEEMPSFKYIEWKDCTQHEPEKIYYGVFDVRENIFMAIPDILRDAVYTSELENGFEIKNKEDDTTLIRVVETETVAKTEQDEYLHTVHLGTKMWNIECNTVMDMDQVEYVYKNITDFY